MAGVIHPQILTLLQSLPEMHPPPRDPSSLCFPSGSSGRSVKVCTSSLGCCLLGMASITSLRSHLHSGVPGQPRGPVLPSPGSLALIASSLMGMGSSLGTWDHRRVTLGTQENTGNCGQGTEEVWLISDSPLQVTEGTASTGITSRACAVWGRRKSRAFPSTSA